VAEAALAAGDEGIEIDTPELAALEQRRRRVLRNYRLTVLALVVAVPAIAAPLLLLAWLGAAPSGDAAGDALRIQLQGWLTPHLPAVGGFLFAAPIVAIFGGLFAFRRYAWLPKHRYLNDYKAQVFTALCRARFPTLSYDPNGGIPYAWLDSSGLFPFSCDVYSSEDRFEGRVGATDVCFSEATAQRKRPRSLLRRDNDEVYETYFRGVIFSADFHKHFVSRTRLLPKGAERRSLASESVAELEDPAFGALFDTLTTDQTDVRYVLSPSLMERLTALHARFRGLRALFAGDHLLLLLPSYRNRFEASLYEPAASRAQLAAFFADVSACLAIVDALNLNTRIWSKA
jgi:hypothetical protein